MRFCRWHSIRRTRSRNATLLAISSGGRRFGLGMPAICRSCQTDGATMATVIDLASIRERAGARGRLAADAARAAQEMRADLALHGQHFSERERAAIRSLLATLDSLQRSMLD